MAKERNLPSKSTFTTSDFIRVVGSDNASYKQQVGNVADTIVENAYLTPPTALSSGANLLTLAVGVYYTPSNDVANSLVNKPSDLSLNCRVEVLSRIPARRAIIITDSANNVWENQMDSASSWTGWKKRPTRAEIDALNSKAVNVVQVTATTTADGAINLSEWVDTSHRVISVVPEGGSAYYVAFPLFRSVNYAMVYTWPTLAKAASVSVTLNVYYR